MNIKELKIKCYCNKYLRCVLLAGKFGKYFDFICDNKKECKLYNHVLITGSFLPNSEENITHTVIYSYIINHHDIFYYHYLNDNIKLKNDCIYVNKETLEYLLTLDMNGINQKYQDLLLFK